MSRISVIVALILALATGSAFAAPSARKAGASKAQVFQGEIWDLSCAKRGSHDVMAKEAGLSPGPHMARKCTILCHEMGSPLVLYNPSTRQIYKLDAQKRVAAFAGEKVEITGTLDAKTKTIHVERVTRDR